MQRKLAAVLYADVAGYSGLMERDEEGTHRLLSRALDAIADSVSRHGGSVAHYAGDAGLAEFSAAGASVHCAILAQAALTDLNGHLDEQERVRFRMGVNLGDDIMDRNDIYGDGVNIAARLETIAAPGGTCISGSVHDALGPRLQVPAVFLGEQRVKSIKQLCLAKKQQLTEEEGNGRGHSGQCHRHE